MMFEKFICSGSIPLRIPLFRSFYSLSNPVVCVKRPSICPATLLTIVRHRKIPVRKPAWMPRAKTKLFIFPKINEFEEDELDQIREVKSNYRLQMMSIRQYCIAENEKLKLENVKEHNTADHEDFLHLLNINKEENERIRKIREAVLAAELESETQALLEQDQADKEWHAAKKEEVKKILEYEKVESAHFVNLENIEEAIKEAIDNPVNYNFAIDLTGSILTSQHLEGSPHWTDDIPHEQLTFPPGRGPSVKRKKKFPQFNTRDKWC